MNDIKSLLQSSSHYLKHLDSRHLDSEVLLSYVLKKPREFLHAHGEHEVAGEAEKLFAELIRRRCGHEPVAYLTTTKAFYGRNFYVDKRVHIPRPETEDMIDLILKNTPNGFSGLLADIGTGSGCIAITLALELPNARVMATDISQDALAVARYNAKTQGLYRRSASAPTANEGQGFPLSGRGAGRPEISTRLAFYRGNLLDPLTEPADIIVSNPPYGWPEGWTLDPEVFFQPKESHQSGTDGLAHITELLTALPKKLARGGQAFIEFDPRQHGTIKKITSHTGYNAEYFNDLSGFCRVIRLTK